MTPWPQLALATASGLCLGSYAVTAGLRWARSEGSTLGRSRCDGCGISLGFAQTIPLLSYLRLGGTCGHCGVRIDPLHIAGELAGAAAILSLVCVAEPVRMAPLAVLALALIAAAAVDARTQRLPNLLTGVVAAAGLSLSALTGLTAVVEGIFAATAAAAVLLSVRALARPTGDRAGLGLGDVKLVAALALWLGSGVAVMIAAAAILGLVAAPWLRDADGKLPFGPFLAVSAWVVGLVAEAGAAPWAI